MDKRSRFLVLGGFGFIGRHTVRALLKAGHAVRVFDRSAPSLDVLEQSFDNLENLEVVTGDFTQKQDITAALKDCDGCIHLVTTTLPASSNDKKIFDVQTNLIGTIQLLETMRELDIKKLVFLSSGGTVYGNPVYLPIDEKHPTNPRSSYGITKLSIEKYCALFNQLYGMKSVIIRLSNPYGPGQSHSGIQGAIPVFAAKALSGQPIEIWGDGNVVRDYIYIDDVAEAIISVINYAGNETVFNIGHGKGTSLKEIVSNIEAVINRTVSVNYLESRSLDVQTNILDISKARNELAWQPAMGLDRGIRRVLDELQEKKSD
ncbi:NAD-dependent epimerase/dehydratase family protein [Ochrobactrum quorumnocens]|uniref:UDP-glucose 4-epimerase n=1 Tax=Ochrobactrum quorumnocens TaxID=271865 RepID=A0A5N1K409_9HYPH|nr:NAD-dependent epimerase/dehydratase family protein [[Ochrobactrum] quorumnocens]KAA9371157.1 NAD-dependent epimerase/dehydratase family protein [[Ochrobactrum] quorumnocens]